jgi:prolipoprotein diacylglyceryltransferase
MAAYALGRLGCQVAGDGDWGIINQSIKPYNWIPGWLWAYDYPHNILKTGVYIPGCDWENYCYHLPIPVYPAPLYETIITTIFLVVLWIVRKRFRIAGRIAALYLILTAIERFFIEEIRITMRYNIFGLQLTEAQAISIFFAAGGIVLYILAPKLKVNKTYLSGDDKPCINKG